MHVSGRTISAAAALMAMWPSFATAQQWRDNSIEDFCGGSRGAQIVCASVERNGVTIEKAQEFKGRRWALVEMPTGARFWVVSTSDISSIWNEERTRQLEVDPSWGSQEFYRYMLGERDGYPLEPIGYAPDGTALSEEERAKYIPDRASQTIREAGFYRSFPIAVEGCERTGWQDEAWGAFLLWGGDAMSAELNFACEMEKNGHRILGFVPQSDRNNANMILFEVFDGTQLWVILQPLNIREMTPEAAATAKEEYNPILSRSVGVHKVSAETPDIIAENPNVLSNGAIGLMRALRAANEEFWGRMGVEE